MKLSDQKLRKAIHILVYGLPKTGKTELVGDLAEDGFNLFWFDFENGSKTLHSSLSQGAKERVEIYQIPDTKDFAIGIETALKVIKPGKHEICHLHGKVACPLCKKESKGFSVFDNLSLGEKDIVVFDSITQLSNSSMNNIGKGKDDDWKPEWTDYRNQGSHLDRFFSTIQNAP